MKAKAIVFLLGAVAGTACDHLHVVFDVLGYPSPVFWGEAWWVPPLYGFSALGLVDGHRLLVKKARAVGWGETLGVLALFVVAYATTAALAQQPWLVVVLLVVPWVAYLYWRGSAAFVAYALGTAAVGVVVESLLQGLGLFAYKAPVVWMVPIWLPALYVWGAAVGAAMHGVTITAAKSP